MVLFQGIDDGRLCFFTDYRSRKARELDRSPGAAMVFYWQPLDRQVRIEGTVSRLSRESSDLYFSSRPRGSRVSAWASTQSAEIRNRSSLEERWTEVEERFRGRDVSRPPHWGGYGLQPARFEFWQGRDNRLHDRIVYERKTDRWTRFRLQP
jgi:pyridoxamine 5'-phosphate oxidase